MRFTSMKRLTFFIMILNKLNYDANYFVRYNRDFVYDDPSNISQTVGKVLMESNENIHCSSYQAPLWPDDHCKFLMSDDKPFVTITNHARITVYPKKYAHGFCFAVLCCGYTMTDFPISNRLTSLALWQSNDCPSASKATLMNMDKYFMWIHYERLHNHNKAKHNKTVCIFLGICCIIIRLIESNHKRILRRTTRKSPNILLNINTITISQKQPKQKSTNITGATNEYYLNVTATGIFRKIMEQISNIV